MSRGMQYPVQILSAVCMPRCCTCLIPAQTMPRLSCRWICPLYSLNITSDSTVFSRRRMRIVSFLFVCLFSFHSCTHSSRRPVWLTNTMIARLCRARPKDHGGVCSPMHDMRRRGQMTRLAKWWSSTVCARERGGSSALCSTQRDAEADE